MRCALLLVGSALLSGQTVTNRSAGTDVNGRPIAGLGTVQTQSEGVVRRTDVSRSVSGGQVPVEAVEEREVSNAGGVRIMERVVQRFDQDGRPTQAERVRIEERRLSDGSLATETATYRRDLNGRMELAERSTAESREAGGRTTTTVRVERPSMGGLELVERREVTTEESGNNSQETQVTLRRDNNGRLQEAARVVVVTQRDGNQTIENRSLYEENNGALRLTTQSVARTAVGADGTERREVDLYTTTTPGRTGSAEADRPQLRERQVVERRELAGGSIAERVTVQRANPNQPDRIGSPELLSETVCTGNCKKP